MRSPLGALIVALLCFPLLVILSGALMQSSTAAVWFPLLLVVTVILLWLFSGGGVTAEGGDQPREVQPLLLDDSRVPAEVHEVMDVALAMDEGGVAVFRGRLKRPPTEAYESLKKGLGASVTPMLRTDEQFGAVVALVPQTIEQATMERPSRPWVNGLLFGLTILTTTWAGASHRGVDLLQSPGQFPVGLPYALGLMLILGAHELGHYFAARYHKIRVTLPYFIPAPFALGTFGAFIRMKSPTEHRLALFDVAVAGPLAGLVFAVPALVIGLQSSEVLTTGITHDNGILLSHDGASVGSSVLLALVAKLAIPEALETGCTVRMSPLAYAGWLGLFVTALNLVPVGQLDGGHIARSMFGTRIGATIGTAAMWTLFLLALFVWPGLLVWAMIVFFMAGQGTPPLEDIEPISPVRRALGWFAFAVLLLIILPLPHALMNEVGIYCPYM